MTKERRRRRAESPGEVKRDAPPFPNLLHDLLLLDQEGADNPERKQEGKGARQRAEGFAVPVIRDTDNMRRVERGDKEEAKGDADRGQLSQASAFIYSQDRPKQPSFN